MDHPVAVATGRRWALALRPLEELASPEAPLPEPEAEQARQRRMTPRREREWRAGRHLIRRLLARHAGLPPEDVAVVRSPGGAPRVLRRRQDHWALSGWDATITHRAGLVGALVWRAPDWIVGLDLERIEPRSRAFLEDFFHPRERDRIRDLPSPHREVATVWCLKEAGLKALRTGLSMDTRRFVTDPGEPGWTLRVEQDPAALTAPAAPLRGVVAASSSWVAAAAARGPGCEAFLTDLQAELETALAEVS